MDICFMHVCGTYIFDFFYFTLRMKRWISNIKKRYVVIIVVQLSIPEFFCCDDFMSIDMSSLSQPLGLDVHVGFSNVLGMPWMCKCLM